MKYAVAVTIALGACLAPRPGFADPILVDFENLDDLTSLQSQIPGLTFSNATVLTAGVSLNEFDFPTRSGSRVIFDDGGGIRIDFDAPVFSVGGYLTYAAPVTLSAFDSAGRLLGSTTSLFATNGAGFGDPGSSPNEFLLLALGNIAYVTFTGSDLGGSFTLDDLTYDVAGVPEPGTLALMALGAAGALARRRRRQPRDQSQGVDITRWTT